MNNHLIEQHCQTNSTDEQCERSGKRVEVTFDIQIRGMIMRIRIDKEIPQMISTEKANFRLRSSSTVAVRIAVFLVLFTGTSLIAAEPMPVIGQPTSVLNFVWHPHSAGLISTGKFNGLGQWTVSYTHLTLPTKA